MFFLEHSVVPSACTKNDTDQRHQLNLFFLITKLTGSYPNSSLGCAFSFLSLNINPHILLIKLISVLSSSCSTSLATSGNKS